MAALDGFRGKVGMFKHIGIALTFMVLFVAGHNGTVGGATRPRTVSVEATLLAFSPHPEYECGTSDVHQVAKYRVERVLRGRYAGKEIVVDHPACDGDVFKDIAVGSRVKLTVRVLREYGVITMHPGIREGAYPKMFYVAVAPPVKI